MRVFGIDVRTIRIRTEFCLTQISVNIYITFVNFILYH